MRTLIITPKNVVPNSDNSRFRYSFSPSITFQTGDKICLATAQIPYSWFNISNRYNNNSFQYYFNGSTFTVNINNSFMTVDELNNYLQFTMINNNHYTLDANGDFVFYLEMAYNTSLYAIQLNCYPISLKTGGSNPKNVSLSGLVPQFIINNNNFTKIIGFSANSYPSANNLTTNQSFTSNIIPSGHPVNAVIINCNLVSQNDISSGTGNALFCFSSNVSFGNQINIEPKEYAWIDISGLSYSTIELFLTDQDGNNLVCNDPNSLFMLLIKGKNE
jgi:hypothetical protein